IDGSVRVYDVSNPGQPTAFTQSGSPIRKKVLTGGYPRSLKLLTDHTYVRPTTDASLPDCTRPPFVWEDASPYTRSLNSMTNHTNVRAGCISRHRTVLLVSGGLIGPAAGVTGEDPSHGVSPVADGRAYLAVLDVTDPMSI